MRTQKRIASHLPLKDTMIDPNDNPDKLQRRRDPVDLTQEQTSVSLEAIQPAEPVTSLIDQERQLEPAGTTVQSVLRAIDIVEILAASSQPLRLQEIAEKAQLNLSTCHHLLNSLVTREFAARVQTPRAYVLGPRISNLAQQSRSRFDLAQIAKPHLTSLSQKTGASSCLATLLDTRLELVAKSDARGGADLDDWRADLSRAAHATAVGKAILAWLPEMQIARVVAVNDLTPFTDMTIQTLGELVESLRLIRRHGFAIEDCEYRPNVSGVASVLRDKSGGVVGAIGCMVPQKDASNERLRSIQLEINATVMSLAQNIP